MLKTSEVDEVDAGNDGDDMTFTTKIAGDSQIASHSDNNSSVSIHTGRVLEFEVECLKEK